MTAFELALRILSWPNVIFLLAFSTLPLVYGLIKEEIWEADKKTKIKGLEK
jgi:hypothetical protein